MNIINSNRIPFGSIEIRIPKNDLDMQYRFNVLQEQFDNCVNYQKMQYKKTVKYIISEESQRKELILGRFLGYLRIPFIYKPPSEKAASKINPNQLAERFKKNETLRQSFNKNGWNPYFKQ